MGKILSVNLSKAKGTRKESAPQALLIAGHGLEGDAHAGSWHRQVSLLPWEKIEAFKNSGAKVSHGDFGENLVVQGIDFQELKIGSKLSCGEAVIAITQFGKECHSHCAIYQQTGDCIMPREGVFAEVLAGGLVKAGDDAHIIAESPLE
ncbi:MAG: MOSC domain-containing protein [Clostridiales bacterium]|jgi:TatD DNase family protein|nr:MOSC domain-containing protein [Clostridiales bacterium]